MVEHDQVTTLTGAAVAIVALARFVSAANPTLTRYLEASLVQAEAAGLKAEDLALLRTLVETTARRPDPS